MTIDGCGYGVIHREANYYDVIVRVFGLGLYGLYIAFMRTNVSGFMEVLLAYSADGVKVSGTISDGLFHNGFVNRLRDVLMHFCIGTVWPDKAVLHGVNRPRYCTAIGHVNLVSPFRRHVFVVGFRCGRDFSPFIS